MATSHRTTATSKRPHTASSGLTIVEVIVALAVLAIVGAAVTTTYLSSIRTNADSGTRTQSAQILNTVGRRVAAAEPGFTPGETAIAVDYGEILEQFPELTREDGFADAERYRFTITNLGEITLSDATAIRYGIEVCTRAFTADDEAERCIAGQTAGPEPGTEEEPGEILEGVI